MCLSHQNYVKCCIFTRTEDLPPCLAVTYTCSALVPFTLTGHGFHSCPSLSHCPSICRSTSLYHPATCFPSSKAPIRLLSPSPRPLVVSRWLPPYPSCPPSYDGGPSHVRVQVGVVHGTVGRHLAKPVIDCAVPLCGTTTITAAKLIFLVRCCVAVRCKI